MKIGTKTIFDKLKAGDRFSAIDTDTKEVKKFIKTNKIYKVDQIHDQVDAVSSTGELSYCEEGEAVTYLGRGF